MQQLYLIGVDPGRLKRGVGGHAIAILLVLY